MIGYLCTINGQALFIVHAASGVETAKALDGPAIH